MLGKADVLITGVFPMFSAPIKYESWGRETYKGEAWWDIQKQIDDCK